MAFAVVSYAIISIALRTTVNKKSMPTVIAASRNFFLFRIRFFNGELGEASMLIRRRIIASTDSKKLRSEKIKGGSCMVYPSRRWLFAC